VSHDTWWSIFTDPNHIVAELMWTVIQDVIIGWLLYRVVFKKFILPKITHKVHNEIDTAHGYNHKEKQMEDNYNEEEDLRALPDTVPDYVAQLFTLSEKMLEAELVGWAVEVRVIANCLAEGLNLDKEEK